jgi:hypothetical protein
MYSASPGCEGGRAGLRVRLDGGGVAAHCLDEHLGLADGKQYGLAGVRAAALKVDPTGVQSDLSQSRASDSADDASRSAASQLVNIS